MEEVKLFINGEFLFVKTKDGSVYRVILGEKIGTDTLIKADTFLDVS